MKLSARGWRRNVQLVLIMSSVRVFLVVMPVIVPFFQSKGLSMQDVFVLQALFMLMVLVLEVPSGYAADLFGRKGALVAGALFCGLGHSVLLFAEGFWDLVLFEACLALARSLVSGADLAIAYESARLAEGGEDHVVVGRLYAWQTASEACAALVCSGIMVLGGLSEVVWLQAMAGWLPLVVVLAIREPPRERMTQGRHTQNFREVLGHILQGGAVLRLTAAVWCVWGLTTYFAVWVMQKIWMAQDIALHHFGYLWAGYMFAAALAGRLALRLETRLGAATVLAVCGTAPVLGYLGLTLPLLSVLFGMLFFVARGLGVVVLQQAFNARVPDAFRATANSLLGFGFSICVVLTGPLVGAMVDAWPMNLALAVLAGFSALVLACLVTPLVLRVRRTTRHPAGEDAAHQASG